ncbi:S8 family peptidase [Yinghuangia soli]|uniref:S8 family peptidase n=1 Tax=Yinghuangia soli TaxID=2908204 RepID=A0AA41Q8Y2_9ACTN|nr:S8 family peptidase [Yinghuangia soli]MCF2532377.1 S8 family peptidase [Yinghuangia soli]
MALAVGAILAAVPGPAHAAPPKAGAANSPGKSSHTSVTLVTGDKVAVDVFADGRRAYTAKPGPGREDVSFLRWNRGDAVTVVPSDAVALLRSGVLDPRLFDISGLVRQGLDDAKAPVLPLIVKYAGGAPAARGELSRMSAPGRDLPSIQAQAIGTPKAAAGQFWGSVTAGSTDPKARSLNPGVARVWLDGRVAASLDRSVPQVGAPAAWQAGFTGAGITTAVLDTGIDAAHPDLKDAVAEAVDFTGTSPSAADGHGHGTHVASIITGSGAASAGQFKGVAPDTRLVVGKVLEDTGFGSESGIIAGMEWAAGKAKVVNMSLGGGPSDGTDPMSLAVNALSASTGALFVIAAGNTPGSGTVSAPSTADAALSVGAVDADDQLGWFSSRGPRYGDYAVKPEITAPGVGIAAARAAGTSLGEPIDDAYTRVGGTSMATPHVAGAAAILAQQHPDWTGTRIKEALTGSAKPTADLPVFAQGTGRLDVAAAVRGTVTASPSAVSAFLRWPTPAPVAKTVSYRNDGDAPLVLDLAAAVANGSGPASLVRVDTPRLTVPAHGTAEARLSIDPAAGPAGVYGGLLTATAADGSVVARTALGVYLEDEVYDVRIDSLNRAGERLTAGALVVTDLATGQQYEPVVSGEQYIARVPKGRYSIDGIIITPATTSRPRDLTLISRPDVAVAGEASVTLDARTGRPAPMTLDRPAARLDYREMTLYQVFAENYEFGLTITTMQPATELYVAPTAPVTSRTFSLRQQAFLTEPAAGSAPPRAYNLTRRVDGGIPNDAAFRSRVAELGSADVRIHNQGIGTQSGGMSRLAGWDGESSYSGWFHDLQFPSVWKEYFSAPEGLSWLGHLSGDTMAEEAQPTRYAPGAHRTVTEQWNRATASPIGWFHQCGEDATMMVKPYSAAVAGHQLDWWGNGSGTLTLLRNGEEVGRVEGTEAWFTGLPPGAADFTLQMHADRGDPSAILANEVDTTWTFRSAAPEGDCGDLANPLLQIRIDGNFDLENKARADRPMPLTVAIERPNGPAPAIRDFKLEASFDKGSTWKRVPVLSIGGKRLALVPPAPQGSSEWVNLRATARDGQGTTVTQTVSRAYGLLR